MLQSLTIVLQIFRALTDLTDEVDDETCEADYTKK